MQHNPNNPPCKCAQRPPVVTIEQQKDSNTRGLRWTGREGGRVFEIDVADVTEWKADKLYYVDMGTLPSTFKLRCPPGYVIQVKATFRPDAYEFKARPDQVSQLIYSGDGFQAITPLLARAREEGCDEDEEDEENDDKNEEYGLSVELFETRVEVRSLPPEPTRSESTKSESAKSELTKSEWTKSD